MPMRNTLRAFFRGSEWSELAADSLDGLLPFVERFADHCCCLNLDGYAIGNGRVVQADPSISDAPPLDFLLHRAHLVFRRNRIVTPSEAD